jgi:SAM-dependent methyltransferase
MSAQNYESKWWGYIYDQMMADDLQDWVDANRQFYESNLRGVTGPVLECACGTGIFLLPLLAAGHNIYGFDISISMLATLKRKAREGGLPEIDARISVQDFESFRYDRQFDAVIIPTNSFGMMMTQDAQIRTLCNIHAHLAPGGRLLLDLILRGAHSLIENATVVEGTWYTWTHPDTSRPIRQRIVGRFDLTNQLTLDQCFIEYEGKSENFPMTGRWIFKEEFQLLLRLGGFERWECFGTPEGDPLEVGLDDGHSYWIAYKA